MSGCSAGQKSWFGSWNVFDLTSLRMAEPLHHFQKKLN